VSPIIRGHWAESFGTLEEHARHAVGVLSQQQNTYPQYMGGSQAQMNLLANGAPFRLEPTMIPAGWTFQDECDYQEYLRTGVLVP
jgi:hypothetical protein